MGESSIMPTRHFECTECGAHGKILLKGDDHPLEDIVYCPVCSADIYEEEDLDEDE
jgi:predicted nucleic acid-binding Zn ribbon protein